MQKTVNYNLNKPEAADPIRVADFNENADIIDAALKELNTAVTTKGNCKLVVGTYVGNGKYGSNSNNHNSLTFDAEPLFLIINGGGYTAYLSETGRCTVANSSGDSIRSMVTYWGKTISWYSSGNDQLQLNVSGTTYTYMAFFA